MSESFKARLDFPSPIIQAQTVRNLVSAVLKEKGQNGTISESSSRGPALEALWEQCCGTSGPVRSTCCDALGLMVEQGHAELHYVLHSALNLLPSASNVQGLVKVVGRLLQLQADQRDKATPYTCPYSIRGNPHPYITALENRPDCWSALLLAIDDFIQQAADRTEPAYVAMLAPFLRYLYCQPQRQASHTLLRHSLLRVLLPACTGQGAPRLEADQPQTSAVSDSLLRCLCQLVPHLRVDSVEAALELHGFVEALLPALLTSRGDHWRSERARMLLQLLCACQLCLQLDADCRPLLHLMQELLAGCQEELPSAELLMGVALLLLEASAAQQTGLLSLALTLAPDQAESSPWGTPVLVLPLLHLMSCFSLTEPLSDPRTHSRNLSLAQSLLDSAQKATLKPSLPGPQLVYPLSPWYSQLQVALSVLRQTDASPPAGASEWLLSVSLGLSSSQHLLPWSLCLLVANCIVAGQADVCPLALRAAQAIAAADPSKVPSLLPVLLFKLEREKDPNLCHAVMYALPNLGTHKLCVPQVLHTIKMLASTPKLRAVGLRLMAALWQKEDRVYTELQRLLAPEDQQSVVLGREALWEQTLARAACLLDVCRERPYQYGGDMLAAITHTLTQCSKPDLAVPASLALQGLQELCRAEVVDIISTWGALGPKLICDTRPPMVQGTAELLALVPQLKVNSEEYERLKEEVVSFLWSYALSKEPETASCGYKALAEFPEAAHTVLHLPERARPVPMHPESEKDEQQNEDEENEKDLSVPGSSYVKLLGLTNMSVQPAYEVFLTSLVRQEMTQMPRGVYLSALRGGNLRSDQGKTVAGIPAFMLKTYEKNKQPGLKPGLAVGLLLCYELPIQTDRDGRPISRFLVSRSRSYRLTLTALIHEVNIQPSEWHRALLLPQAWFGFMSRAFHAVLQGRRADLEMQQKQGKQSPEELQYKQHCAWLWARDELTDAIKSAAKDSPVVQGNSILALSGLAAVLAKYESNMPADAEGLEAGPEMVPTSSWLAMVLDTLLSMVSSGYKARGQVFPWFLHRSYTGENTASSIARSCAALGLSLAVPALVAWHRDSVAGALTALRAGLPGSPTADESQAIQFHSGLALGLLLARLHQEHLSDVSLQKDADLLQSSLDDLERCSFQTNLEYRTGCVLGLGLVLAALCGSRHAEHKVRITLTLDRLLAELQQDSDQGRMLQEVLAYSVASVGVLAFSGNIIDANMAAGVMVTLRTLTEESQQTPGFSLALGLAVHGLSSRGHGKAEDLLPRLLAAWVKILLSEGCPTMQRLAAVSGLASLVGSETHIIQLKSEAEQTSQQQVRLNEVIRSVTQIITYSGALGLQSNSACLVGHLHLAHMSTSQVHTAVPQDYSYLSEKSLIRSTVEFLTEAGRKGPEVFHPGPVNTALAPLASVGPGFQYPPVNWSAILSPLMRLNFGEDVQHHCIALAVTQAQSSQSASLFLGSWISPPLVHSLSRRTRGHLYETLGTWMKHVAEDKLQVYAESQGTRQFEPEQRAQRGPLCRALLQGLAQAMALPNPPNSCWAILCSTAEKVFNLLPNRIQNDEVDLYVGVAKCLSELSDTEIDRIAQVTEAYMEKSCFVLAYLTSQGRVPLLSLNDVIAAVLRGWPSHRVGWLLLQTLYQCRLASSPNTGVSKRLEWLLELMGHIRNVAHGTTTVTCGDPKLATDFLFQLFAAAVVCWGDHAMPLLLGIRPQWFPWEPGCKPPTLPHRLYGEESVAEDALPRCMLGLPHSLTQLLAKEPWRSQSQKFIDWLLNITEDPQEGLSETSISTAKAALVALRSSEEFKKKTVWTRAYGW